VSPVLAGLSLFSFSFCDNRRRSDSRCVQHRGCLGLPGFEALYAVAGLLAVAFLVIRRRK
jgi:PGF-CTERM protein